MDLANQGLGFAPSYRLSVFTTAASSPFPGDVGVRANWILARIEMCPVRIPAGRPLAVQLCAALDGGVLRSEGTGLPVIHDDNRPWIAAAGLVRVAWNLADATWLEASAGVSVAFERYRFSYERGGVEVDVSQTADAGGVLALGAGYRFP